VTLCSICTLHITNSTKSVVTSRTQSACRPVSKRQGHWKEFLFIKRPHQRSTQVWHVLTRITEFYLHFHAFIHKRKESYLSSYLLIHKNHTHSLTKIVYSCNNINLNSTELAMRDSYWYLLTSESTGIPPAHQQAASDFVFHLHHL